MSGLCFPDWYAGLCQMAYDRGANYIYRVNDDSEMIDPWARSFADALEVSFDPEKISKK